MTYLGSIGVVIIAGSLAGCDIVEPLRSMALGLVSPDWNEITLDDSQLQVDGYAGFVQSVKSRQVGERYQEEWGLRGGFVYYEAVSSGGYGQGTLSANLLANHFSELPALQTLGVRVAPSDIVAHGDLRYALTRVEEFSCFQFLTVFGDERIESVGDQLLTGAVCRFANDPEAAALGRLAIAALASIKRNGEQIVSAPT